MSLDNAPLPRLALGALGGTLSMAAKPGETGIVPAINADDWVKRLPQLYSLAEVRAQTLCLVPSPSLEFQQVLVALAWARAQVRGGATGVVITQGTDTLEETAYLLGLLWDEAAPMVLTGAMRGADHPEADAPANVLAAARVALTTNSRHRGVMVVMHNRIHCPTDVRKVHAQTLDAFASLNTGPMGWVTGDSVTFAAAIAARRSPLGLKRTNHRVALLEATLGESEELVEYAAGAGYEGLVIAGFGAGHVPASWVPTLERVARYIPVIVASRTGAGSTTSGTYGFAGGEIDLQRRGLHMAGALCPRKCRLLLWALLGAGEVDQLGKRLGAVGV